MDMSKKNNTSEISRTTTSQSSDADQTNTSQKTEIINQSRETIVNSEKCDAASLCHGESLDKSDNKCELTVEEKTADDIKKEKELENNKDESPQQDDPFLNCDNPEEWPDNGQPDITEIRDTARGKSSTGRDSHGIFYDVDFAPFKDMYSTFGTVFREYRDPDGDAAHWKILDLIDLLSRLGITMYAVSTVDEYYKKFLIVASQLGPSFYKYLTKDEGLQILERFKNKKVKYKAHSIWTNAELLETAIESSFATELVDLMRKAILLNLVPDGLGETFSKIFGKQKKVGDVEFTHAMFAKQVFSDILIVQRSVRVFIEGDYAMYYMLGNSRDAFNMISLQIIEDTRIVTGGETTDVTISKKEIIKKASLALKTYGKLKHKDKLAVHKLYTQVAKIYTDYKRDIDSMTRDAPVGILLWGAPQIGKGLLVTHVTKMYCAWAGIQYTPNMTYRRDPDEEFFSGYDPDIHSIMHIPEPGSLHPDLAAKNGDPAMKQLLTIISEQPMKAVMADVDSKGKLPIAPKLVIMDANNEDLNLDLTISNPAAVRRRLIYVKVSVKEQYRDKKGSNSDALDQSILRDMGKSAAECLDIWDFKVYEKRPKNSKQSFNVPCHSEDTVHIGGLFYCLKKCFDKRQSNNSLVRKVLDLGVDSYPAYTPKRAKAHGNSLAIGEVGDFPDMYLDEEDDPNKLSDKEKRRIIRDINVRVIKENTKVEREKLRQEIEREKAKYFPADYQPDLWDKITMPSYFYNRVFAKKRFKEEFKKTMFVESYELIKNIFNRPWLSVSVGCAFWFMPMFGVFSSFIYLALCIDSSLSLEKVSLLDEVKNKSFIYHTKLYNQISKFNYLSKAHDIANKIKPGGSIYKVLMAASAVVITLTGMMAIVRAFLPAKENINHNLLKPAKEVDPQDKKDRRTRKEKKDDQNINVTVKVCDTNSQGFERPVKKDMTPHANKEVSMIETVDDYICAVDHKWERYSTDIISYAHEGNIYPRLSFHQRCYNDESEVYSSIVRNKRTVQMRFGNKGLSTMGLGLCKDVLVVNSHCLKATLEGKTWSTMTISGSSKKRTSLCTIQRSEMIVYDNGDDLSFIRVPGALYADITDLLAENINILYNQRLLVYNRTSSRLWWVEGICCSESSYKTEGGQSTLSYPIAYRCECKPGHCGTPKMICTNKAYFLGGIHAAGEGDQSLIAPLTKNIVHKALKHLNANKLSMGVLIMPDKMEITKVGHRSSICAWSNNSYTTCSFKIMGGVTGKSHNNSKSRLELYKWVPKMFSYVKINPYDNEGNLIYQKPLMEPVRLDKQTWLKPYGKWLEKVKHQKPTLKPFAIDNVIKTYLNYVLKNLRDTGQLGPVPLDVAINGSPDDPLLRPLNKSTSAGCFWTGKKKDYLIEHIEDGIIKFSCSKELKKSIKRIFESYSRNEMCHPVLGANLKDEPVSVQKRKEGKTRVFFSCPIDMVIVQRQMLMCLYTLMVDQHNAFRCKLGINMQGPESDHMYREITEFSNNIFEGDYSGYDTSFPLDIGKAANTFTIELLKAKGYPKSDLDTLEKLLEENLNPTVYYDGVLLIMPGIQPSGKYGTAEDNSIRGIILLLYGWHEMMCNTKSRFYLGHDNPFTMESFFSETRIYVYGDDVVGSVSDNASAFNNISYSQFCADCFGCKFTPSTKTSKFDKDFVDKEHMSFLKRSFRYSRILNRYVAPLGSSSFVKMLTYYNSDSKVDNGIPAHEVLFSFLNEIFLTCDSKEDFENYRNGALKMLEENYPNLNRTLDLPTYEVIKDNLGTHEIRAHFIGAIKKVVKTTKGVVKNVKDKKSIKSIFKDAVDDVTGIPSAINSIKNRGKGRLSAEEMLKKGKSISSKEDSPRIRKTLPGTNVTSGYLGGNREKYSTFKAHMDTGKMSDLTTTDLDGGQEVIVQDIIQGEMPIGGTTAIIPRRISDNEHTIHELLCRQVDIGKFLPSEDMIEFPPFCMWIKHELISKHIFNYASFSCNLRLTFEWVPLPETSGMWHIGNFPISNGIPALQWYRDNSDLKARKALRMFINQSQDSACFRLGMGTAFSYMIPFVYEFDSVNLDSDIDDVMKDLASISTVIISGEGLDIPRGMQFRVMAVAYDLHLGVQTNYRAHSANITDCVDKTSVEPKPINSHVGDNFNSTGMEGGNADFSEIFNKDYLLAEKRWRNDTQPHLMNIPVTPFYGLSLKSNGPHTQLTPLGYYGFMFQNWRGSLVYTVMIEAPKIASGKIVIRYSPSPVEYNHDDPLEGTGLYKEVVLDLEKDQRTAEFAVGFGNEQYLRCGVPSMAITQMGVFDGVNMDILDAWHDERFSNGFIDISIYEKIYGLTSAKDLKLNVFVRSPDLKFYVPTSRMIDIVRPVLRSPEPHLDGDMEDLNELLEQDDYLDMTVEEIDRRAAEANGYSLPTEAELEEIAREYPEDYDSDFSDISIYPDDDMNYSLGFPVSKERTNIFLGSWDLIKSRINPIYIDARSCIVDEDDLDINSLSYQWYLHNVGLMGRALKNNEVCRFKREPLIYDVLLALLLYLDEVIRAQEEVRVGFVTNVYYACEVARKNFSVLMEIAWDVHEPDFDFSMSESMRAHSYIFTSIKEDDTGLPQYHENEFHSLYDLTSTYALKLHISTGTNNVRRCFQFVRDIPYSFDDIPVGNGIAQTPYTFYDHIRFSFAFKRGSYNYSVRTPGQSSNVSVSSIYTSHDFMSTNFFEWVNATSHGPCVYVINLTTAPYEFSSTSLAGTMFEPAVRTNGRVVKYSQSKQYTVVDIPREDYTKDSYLSIYMGTASDFKFIHFIGCPPIIVARGGTPTVREFNIPMTNMSSTIKDSVFNVFERKHRNQRYENYNPNNVRRNTTGARALDTDIFDARRVSAVSERRFKEAKDLGIGLGRDALELKRRLTLRDKTHEYDEWERDWIISKDMPEVETRNWMKAFREHEVVYSEKKRINQANKKCAKAFKHIDKNKIGKFKNDLLKMAEEYEDKFRNDLGETL